MTPCQLVNSILEECAASILGSMYSKKKNFHWKNGYTIWVKGKPVGLSVCAVGERPQVDNAGTVKENWCEIGV